MATARTPLRGGSTVEEGARKGLQFELPRWKCWRGVRKGLQLDSIAVHVVGVGGGGGQKGLQNLSSHRVLVVG